MRLFLYILIIAVVHANGAENHTVHVKAEDTEMNAAIDAARKTLPVFWKAYTKPAPDESEFFLKLAITDGKETEHFWLGKIRKEKERFVGIIANDPELVSHVKFGQKFVTMKRRFPIGSL